MAKKDLKTRMKEITDELEQGVKNVFSSGQYAQYLRTMSQFHHYSFRNSLLIHFQRPNAKLVAGFNTWKNKFGRYVNKGEKGIHILAPTPYKKHIEVSHDKQGKPLLDENGQPTSEIKEITIPAFKPVFVFDVSQTSGRELPSLNSELFGDVKNYDLLFESLKNVSPYPIEFETIKGRAEGYCDYINKRIVLNASKDQAQNVGVALHEMAHARLHQPDLPLELQKDRQTEEIEAESVSYVVGAYYGIQTDVSSFGYIAGWSKDQELNKLQASLETIQKAASELINDIDGQMQELTQQKEAEQLEYGEYVFSEQEIDAMTIGNYLSANHESNLLSIGVPVGSVSQLDINGNRLTKREFEQMTKAEYDNIKVITKCIPLKTLTEIEQNRLSHFESLTIHPKFIPVNQVSKYITVLDYLQMFSNQWDSIFKHMQENKPITFEKMMQYRDHYLTNKLLQDVSKNHPDVTIDEMKALLGIQEPGKASSIEQSPVYQLINNYEQNQPVFGQEEKEILIRYAEHQGNFDKVALLANELADSKYELKHGHVNIGVKARIDTFCKQVNRLTQAQNNSTPPVPIRIDAPFVPPVELLNYNPNADKSGNFKYQVAENGKVFGIDGKEDGLFPVQTVDLDTKNYSIVGFNRLREYTFETTSYYNCLFENNAVNIDTMLHIPDHPGLWKCVDKITLRDDTYFAVANYSKEIPDEFMVLNQTGNVFIEQAFKGIECNWGHSDLRDAVSSTLADQAIEIYTSRTEHPIKPSIGGKLAKAKQSLVDKIPANKLDSRTVCAGMER